MNPTQSFFLRLVRPGAKIKTRPENGFQLCLLNDIQTISKLA